MFIIAIILWVIMLIAAVYAVLVRGQSGDGPGPVAGVVAAVVCGVLGFVAFAWAGVHSVPSKSIGVPVSLGKVGTGYASPGAHFTWDPFLHYAIINETIQTTTFQQGSNLPGTQQCSGELPVRIGGQQSACAKITIQWRVKPSAAASLFSDYANQGDLMTTIENALVIREMELVVNQQVGEYDPITDYRNVVNTKTNTSQFTAFGPDIQATMTKDIGSQIQVTSVLFPKMTYSPAVENKLQQIQQAYANFAIAQENVLVNHENALAFANLGTPNVNQLVAQCLQDSRENRTSPMGCFPGQASGLTIGK
jgi:regulator of protease activity HflC (stomatin/prohibitin superfamily)